MTLEKLLYLGILGAFLFVWLAKLANDWYNDIWKE